VLRGIFGPKTDEVIGEWRRLHNKEHYSLHSSPDMIQVIKSGELRRAVYEARMGESRGAYRVLVGKPGGRRYLEEPGVDGRIILKWILDMWDRRTDWIDLAQDKDSCGAVVNAVMNLRIP
jgi:hypothetical protein